MSASIKILKDSLKKDGQLSARLSLLCVKVQEELDACIYSPEPGVLMTFIKLLSEHNISYEMVYGHEGSIARPEWDGP